MARLKFLEEAQWWDREKIESYRNSKLKNLITVAYKEVPFYREIFDASGIRPHEIKCAEDLSKLPVVTKDMLRKGYPNQVTRPTGQKTYEASTSGSTGKNFFVREDAATAGWYRASFLLALEWAGWRIGDAHLQTGMTLNRTLDRKLKDWLMNCRYVSAYELDDFHLEQMLSIIESNKIQFIFGYPGSLYYLARYAGQRGWNLPLKAAVTWGDMLLPHYRQEIENVFKVKVFDTYGCAEGFHISAQCEFGSYHIHALDVIAEFLDNNGAPINSGDSGKIIITRLHPGPMPFIRYSTGDIGVPLINGQCNCNRGFPIMKSIIGRSSDVVITPSGNRLIIHFFTGILEHFTEIDVFQVIQEDRFNLTLRVVPFGNLRKETMEIISKSLWEHGCKDMKISFEIVESIPTAPTGKNQFIVSKLDSESLNY